MESLFVSQTKREAQMERRRAKWQPRTKLVLESIAQQSRIVSVFPAIPQLILQCDPAGSAVAQ
jgi:hypothetical protein